MGWGIHPHNAKCSGDQCNSWSWLLQQILWQHLLSCDLIGVWRPQESHPYKQLCAPAHRLKIGNCLLLVSNSSPCISYLITCSSNNWLFISHKHMHAPPHISRTIMSSLPSGLDVLLFYVFISSWCNSYHLTYCKYNTQHSCSNTIQQEVQAIICKPKCMSHKGYKQSEIQMRCWPRQRPLIL